MTSLLRSDPSWHITKDMRFKKFGTKTIEEAKFLSPESRTFPFRYNLKYNEINKLSKNIKVFALKSKCGTSDILKRCTK